MTARVTVTTGAAGGREGGRTAAAGLSWPAGAAASPSDVAAPAPGASCAHWALGADERKARPLRLLLLLDHITLDRWESGRSSGQISGLVGRTNSGRRIGLVVRGDGRVRPEATD